MSRSQNSHRGPVQPAEAPLYGEVEDFDRVGVDGYGTKLEALLDKLGKLHDVQTALLLLRH